jgi:hypothetical protein
MWIEEDQPEDERVCRGGGYGKILGAGTNRHLRPLRRSAGIVSDVEEVLPLAAARIETHPIRQAASMSKPLSRRLLGSFAEV